MLGWPSLLGCAPRLGHVHTTPLPGATRRWGRWAQREAFWGKFCPDLMFVPQNVMRVTGQSPLPPPGCGLHFQLLMTLAVPSSCCLRFNLVLCLLLVYGPKEAALLSVLLSP